MSNRDDMAQPPNYTAQPPNEYYATQPPNQSAPPNNGYYAQQPPDEPRIPSPPNNGYYAQQPPDPYYQPQYYDPQYFQPQYFGTQYAVPGCFPPKKPAYKKWWFWLIIGVVVVALVLTVSHLVSANLPYYDDENYQMRFLTIINGDKMLDFDEVQLTLNDIHYAQQYIAEKYPDFDFEANGYKTDDASNQILLDEFNNSPGAMTIYMYGQEDDAGLSGAYAVFLEDSHGRLLSYDYIRDQEFSDLSGIEYTYFYYGYTTMYGEQIYSLQLVRDEHAYYENGEESWYIVWEPDSSGDPAYDDETRKAALEDFLFDLSYTIVYEQLDWEFLYDVYTGIGEETIGDLIE